VHAKTFVLRDFKDSTEIATSDRMPYDASFRGLKVWQLSMTLVEEIYSVSGKFPRYELFGLTSQIRRASISIPSNIAEGKRRKRQLVYLNHLDIALGSQGEVEVQLEVAKRVGFLTSPDYDRIQAIVEEVGRMLNGLIAALQRPTSNG
jgi:four helix bundle protein